MQIYNVHREEFVLFCSLHLFFFCGDDVLLISLWLLYLPLRYTITNCVEIITFLRQLNVIVLSFS